MKTKSVDGRIRLGMIAMSGVRAENKELVELGLTLPGFIERSKVIASLPSLSLLTLAGMTPPSFEVSYHEIASFSGRDELPEHFDIVAITSLSAQIAEAYQVADHFRSDGAKVVMGGLHVSTLPEEALRHCDAVVVGEGEPVWNALLDDLVNDSLRSIYQSAGSFDLADAPMPRFDLLDPAKYNRITVQTSRGCPHKCEFCASSILLTPRYKLKPVAKVIAEIRAIKRIWPRPFIEFADDNSFVHKTHYKALLRELVAERIRWFTEADLAVADDPELLDLMRVSGCEQVLIGLESPRISSLRGVELASDWKARRRQHYLEAIERIQSHGITVNGCFILGLDGDTPDVFDEVIDFVRESGLYEVQVTLLTAFPGTPLYRRLAAEGRLIEPGNCSLRTLFDHTVVPRDMSLEELRTGFLRLVATLYSDEETSRRRRNFHRRRLAGRKERRVASPS